MKRSSNPPSRSRQLRCSAMLHGRTLLHRRSRAKDQTLLRLSKTPPRKGATWLICPCCRSRKSDCSERSWGDTLSARASSVSCRVIKTRLPRVRRCTFAHDACPRMNDLRGTQSPSRKMTHGALACSEARLRIAASRKPSSGCHTWCIRVIPADSNRGRYESTSAAVSDPLPSSAMMHSKSRRSCASNPSRTQRRASGRL